MKNITIISKSLSLSISLHRHQVTLKYARAMSPSVKPPSSCPMLPRHAVT